MGCCSTLAVGQSISWGYLHLFSMVALLVANAVLYEKSDMNGYLAENSPCLELSRYMLFECVWAVVGLGWFVLITLWRVCDEKSFWKSGTLKCNLTLGLIYFAGGAAAAFGGGYLYNQDANNCTIFTTDINNMALADAVAGVFIRLPYTLITLSLLINEAWEPGSLRKSFDSLTDKATGVFMMCTVRHQARLMTFTAIFIFGLIPLLIANGVVITEANSLTYSAGNPCLYLYRYCEFETVYPIVGLGFALFAFLCRAVSAQGFQHHFRIVLVPFIIYVTAGIVVLLYAISLITSDANSCRAFSDAIPNMATIDIVVNGFFRIPFFAITLFCMLTFNVQSAESIELKSPH